MKFSAKCRTFHLLDSSVILACQANQEMARYLTSNTTSTTHDYVIVLLELYDPCERPLLRGGPQG